MQIEQRAKLAEAIRILREIMGEATQLPLIPPENEIANMDRLHHKTVTLSRELYQKYLQDWIDPKDPNVMASMARHGQMNLSNFLFNLENRKIVEVRRTKPGHGTRILSFRYILKVPHG